MHALASAPPPTCTTNRSGAAPADPRASAISQPSVAPPSMVSPLSGPWQPNGMAPAPTAARNR